MDEFLKLIPRGWTFIITYQDKRNIYDITILDNCGAINRIEVTPEFIRDNNNSFFVKEIIEKAVRQINQLYGL